MSYKISLLPLVIAEQEFPSFLIRTMLYIFSKLRQRKIIWLRVSLNSLTLQFTVELNFDLVISTLDLNFDLVVPAPVRRQPTDFLPNSPSTSAGSTRTQFSAKASQPTSVPSEAELMAKRHPIVSLFYQAHEGVPADAPYSVKTKQLVSLYTDLYTTRM